MRYIFMMIGTIIIKIFKSRLNLPRIASIVLVAIVLIGMQSRLVCQTPLFWWSSLVGLRNSTYLQTHVRWGIVQTVSSVGVFSGFDSDNMHELVPEADFIRLNTDPHARILKNGTMMICGRSGVGAAESRCFRF